MSDMHAADRHDVIRVRGARVNNLQGIDVDIPKRRLTVFTGVSGSGKSSLVFGTIAAESQRLINETYPAFLQSFMGTPPRPEVDQLAGVTPAIVVDQERLQANSRSTVGTVTDAYAMLRVLYSRRSEPHVGSSQAFAFNIASASGSGMLKKADGTAEHKTFEVVGGMCPQCEGKGKVSQIDESAIVDVSLSLNDGAVLVPGMPTGSWQWRSYAESEKLDPDKVLSDYTPDEWHWLMHQETTKIRFGGINYSYLGLVERVRRGFIDRETESKQAHVREYAAKVATFDTCPACHGTRLAEASRTATVAGRTIPECSAMQVSDLLAWVEALDEPGVGPLVDHLAAMLRGFVDIGLGYLSLDRESGTLSGGEAQRVKMIRHLGSALTDVTYVFDEPTIGLHPHDIRKMNDLLLQLRDKGNSVLVVEHKPEVMEIADRVVDLGPGAGRDGGTITFEGDVSGLRASNTLTGRYLDHRVELREPVREASGQLEIRGASTHNLRDVDVDVPTGVLCVVTGVAGSGKSSLIHGSLGGRDDVLVVDQGAIKGSRRSNPATYTGLLDGIRTAFAKENGVKPALFSANSEGACEMCNGQGVIYTDLAMMAGVAIPCEACEGRRFKPEVLQYTLHGLTIAEVLDLSLDQAAEVFTTGKPKTIITKLRDVGLGYLTLGQPLITLSGGERQRIKLAAQLGKERAIIVLDEPTAGLHLADTERLLTMLHGLVDQGHSLVVIEHNLAVMAQADWIIDIGPGAGHDGGQVVFTGTPTDMVAKGSGATAEVLAEYVGA